MKIILSLLAMFVFLAIPSFALQQEDQTESSVVVAPVSDKEPEVTAQSLADRFRKKLNTAENLQINSRQRVTYLVIPLLSGEIAERDVLRAVGKNAVDNSAPPPIIIDVVVNNTMTSDGLLESTFWRKGVDRPITKLKIGHDICSVTHYYPVLGTENSITIQTSELGENEDFFDYVKVRMDNPLLAEISGACGTTEFWYNWIGNDFGWSEAISLGELQGLEVYQGKEVYKIEREVYRENFGSRVDIFFIKPDGLLVGNKVLVSYFVEGELAFYQVLDASYDYTFSLEVSSSE